MRASAFISPTVVPLSRLRGSRPHAISMSSSSSPANSDLLIVGAGTLGRLVAAQWQKLHPEATVIGETRTESSHGQLAAAGIEPALSGSTERTPSHMVICLPPSGASDYAGFVAQTTKRTATSARVVLTSSGSVHGVVSHVTETTPVGETERAKTLYAAESAVLERENGIVVRLSGLYTRERGAHSYWLRAGMVKGSEDGRLNLIHYEDAASAVVAALRVPREEVRLWPRRTCLASARGFVTRRECCEAAVGHPLFRDAKMPEFVDGSGDEKMRREYDNEWTRKILPWTPRWESFVEFMKEDGSR